MSTLPKPPDDVKPIVTLLYPDLKQYAQISRGHGSETHRLYSTGSYDPGYGTFEPHRQDCRGAHISHGAFLFCLDPYGTIQVGKGLRLRVRLISQFGHKASGSWLDWLIEQNISGLPGPKPSAFIIDPAPIPLEPLPAKPAPTTRKAIPKPQARSVGRIRKFAWIHTPFMELMEADGLPMICIEVYRIILTFRQFPERPRERPTGRGPRHPFAYTTIYQSQISDYLEARRKDMTATARADRRSQAERMGTSLSTVKRATRRLCRDGYIGRVHPGRPEDCPWLTEEQQLARIQRHERHPQWGPQKYIVATDRRQRGLLKTLNRKLKKAGLPPYLIYLKDLKT